MKCSAHWVYYDIPHIYLFSELHIIFIRFVENVEKIKLIEKKSDLIDFSKKS